MRLRLHEATPSSRDCAGHSVAQNAAAAFDVHRGHLDRGVLYLWAPRSAPQQGVLPTRVSAEPERAGEAVVIGRQPAGRGAGDAADRDRDRRAAAAAGRSQVLFGQADRHQKATLASLTVPQQQAVTNHSIGGSGTTSATYTGTTSTQGGKAVAFAYAQLGKPYQWGATGPGSFDCSGLAQAAWAAAGVSIPRTTYAQWAALPHVSASAPRARRPAVLRRHRARGHLRGGGYLIECPRRPGWTCRKRPPERLVRVHLGRRRPPVTSSGRNLAQSPWNDTPARAIVAFVQAASSEGSPWFRAPGGAGGHLRQRRRAMQDEGANPHPAGLHVVPAGLCAAACHPARDRGGSPGRVTATRCGCWCCTTTPTASSPAPRAPKTLSTGPGRTAGRSSASGTTGKLSSLTCKDAGGCGVHPPGM